MGLEGAVHLGYRKELESAVNPEKRQILFDSLLEDLYAKGAATESAAFVEIDAIIAPQETRSVVITALTNARKPSNARRHRMVDVW